MSSKASVFHLSSINSYLTFRAQAAMGNVIDRNVPLAEVVK